MSMVRSLGHVATMLATVAIIMVVAVGGTVAGGNNGTLKIHDLRLGSRFINNEPKVCQFNVEAFNLDPGQNGYLVFTSQGGDRRRMATWSWTRRFDEQVRTPRVTPSPRRSSSRPVTGRPPSTTFGASGYEDVKAKSKVFKKTCGGSPEDGGGGGGGGVG